MTTRRLYHVDSSILTVTTLVSEVTHGPRGWWVVPEATVVFPGGGGQPGDRGTLQGTGILESEGRDEAVAHLVETLPAGLVVGAPVTIEIDGNRRLESAQQHTGQHVVSAALLEAAGLETISVHMGEDTMTVESPVPSIDTDVLRRVQRRANTVIREGRPVIVHEVDADGLERFHLRRPAARRDRYRVVEIQGVDASACGGVHVKGTADVGLVLFVGAEKIRGHTRTHWLVGERAWRDLDAKGEILGELCRTLTTTPGELVEAVRRQRVSVTDHAARIAALEAEVARLHADVLASGVPPDPATVVTAVYRGLDRGVFRALVQELTRREGLVAVVANHDGETAQIAAARGPGVRLDLSARLAPHLALAGVTGGGKGGLWQGVARRPEGVPAFLQAVASDRRAQESPSA